MAAKKKILIIDDEEDFLNEITEMLRLSGYEPFPLSESKSAASEARRIKPDIIFLDLKMDKKSGFQVADELSGFTETRHIPIIAITGVFTDKEHRLLMKACNIRECITKPAQPLDIIHLIEAIG